jgi:CheY-like chemotaxis protein
MLWHERFHPPKGRDMSVTERPILLVEDNDDDAFAIERVVKEAGVHSRILRVAGGQQAMDYLEGRGEFADRSLFPLPGLVFLDLQLPQRSGFEILQWMRSKPVLRDIIVVVITDFGNPRDVSMAYEWGARSYLTKPASVRDIKELIESLKSCWIGLQGFFGVDANQQLAEAVADHSRPVVAVVAQPRV